MTRTISRRGEEFIARWEAVILYVYDDKAPLHHGKPPEWDGGPVRGTLTIGIGHTDAAKDPLKCMKGLRITREQAFEILGSDLADVARHVNQMVKVPLTQGQFDALLSLTYNMGEGNLRKSSLLAKLNKGDYRGARACFDLYTKSKGEHMDGLQRRRDAEQLLWDEQDAPHAAAPIPPEADFVETPKTDAPQPPKTMSASKIGNAQIATGAGTAFTAGATIAEKVNDAATSVPPVPDFADKVNDAVEKGTHVVDTVRTVADSATDAVPLGTKIIHFLADPVILGAVAILIIGLCAFAWWERRRHLKEDGV